MEDETGLIAAVLFALMAAGLAYVVVYPYLSDDAKAKKRAATFVSASREKTGVSRAAADPAKRRKAIAESLKEMESSSKKKKVTLEQRIAQAGLQWSKTSYLVGSAGFGLFLALVLLIVNGNMLVTIGGFFIGMLGAPSWLLSFLRKRRINQFVQEFPGAIDIIIRGIRSGLPVVDCFRVIAGEAQEPVRGEFRQIIEAQAVGLSLGEATERLVDRMPIPEASFFSIVVNISQKSGGNLSEALGNLSNVLRDRKKMKGKVQAMSTEAKASAGIIGSLPFVVGGAVYMLQPAYIMLLFTTNGGKITVAVSLVWMSIGVMVMRKMIDFDI
ncbi:type II secretion system F family protein [Methylocystis heyeri]|uniref:Pilus assembly protein n=1 Tax=Methylocystis heyeri TaxID=391905 RepID=A0A6B8KD67_9HYPH|nr:type II secretion system F family protein [Methylocystis heyeri]QGM46176.1 pilus assembly protein [Methylocystis heyeri]